MMRSTVIVKPVAARSKFSGANSITSSVWTNIDVVGVKDEGEIGTVWD